MRTLGVAYGLVSLAGGVAVFVLFVRIPGDLLFLLPPVGRLILAVAPWLVAGGQASLAGVLGPLLAALVFVGYGLWSLRAGLS